ncbi:TonB-dependent receptor [Sphingosinicella rhizophila]|uniref:TonB-dependent receptor n=1 Tax=Sphingosinicella rhizophila TaxID=3050082 RepID=A0ABU3Q6X9_9SPHN|nr:TonB-dependent receptor [Sphingosinicella sp. GR2756]MDT9598738.1 TonB-dependent receptor [Sphingosinicella sp. GR2756]
MGTIMTACLKPKALLLSTTMVLLLLPAAQARAEDGAQRDVAASDASQDQGEIVVTARKQSESSLDVPMGLTALGGEQLEREQSYRLEDFVGKVPGLNMSEAQGTQLVIRGIASTGFSINAPVATYIDDTPLVGVGPFSGGSANTPNFDTFDVARVEVLKGPQGTLYGATALGGVLKYVTNAPDPSGFAAKVHGGLFSVAHADGVGHNLHGMINVPLSDTLAFRAVGYHNEYPGYIDDPSRDREDIHDMRVYGGRASLLWQASPDLSIRLNALTQQRRWDGLAYVEVDGGTLAPLGCDYCQTRFADQPGESRLQMYNATVNWDLGGVALTSSTTYDKWRFRNFSELIGLGPTAGFLKEGLPGLLSGDWTLLVDFDYKGDEIVHETRLASDGDNWLNWQVGVYYTDKEASQDQKYLAYKKSLDAVVPPEVGGSFQPTTYRELAGFGNLNFEVTSEFDFTLGGRISDQKQTFEQLGRLVAPSAPFTTTTDTVFTWSADARYRVTPDNMVYVRVATGFVPGGPNVAPLTPDPNFPATFESSTTTNYEIGYKGSLLENALTVELAAYRIDWKDIQVGQRIGIYNALANGATARSQGFEWAFNYKPIAGLTLGFNGAYTDAKLTKDSEPSVVGRKGDRLPITPKWQLAASADYKWPMFGVDGFVGADWRYKSNYFGELVTLPTPRQLLPGYHVFDLRAGVEADNWRLSFYVKNVGDVRAISYLAQETALTYFRAYLITPRTIGVDLTFDF